MPLLIDHLESFCGSILHGTSVDPDGKKMPFQLIRLESGPWVGTTTFCTLGLSSYPLKSAGSDKIIRQELPMLAYTDAVPRNMLGVLHQVATEGVARGLACLRGETISRQGSLFEGTKMTALYASAPSLFPDAFGIAPTETLGKAVFAWLMPITTAECRFVAEHGWPAFETASDCACQSS